MAFNKQILHFRYQIILLLERLQCFQYTKNEIKELKVKKKLETRWARQLNVAPSGLCKYNTGKAAAYN